MTDFYREIPTPAEDICRTLLAIEKGRCVCVLDSGGFRPPDARYLIAGYDPDEVISGIQEHSVSTTASGGAKTINKSIVDLIEERLAQFESYPSTDLLPAVGALVVAIDYELGYQFDRYKLPDTALYASFPVARAACFRSLVIHDYKEGRSYITDMRGESALQASTDRFLALVDTHKDKYLERRSSQDSAVFADSNFTREEYLSAVRRIKGHIAAGDIYQANLTQRFTVNLNGETDAESIFTHLRRENPASFAAYLRFRDLTIVSASPERFLSVQKCAESRLIEACPIKGTRGRGTSADEDARLRNELINSQKDRAENVMIVDLVRNDLGRVCKFGTVTVPELFAVQEHPTLFHLVSHVTGELKSNARISDILKATFPSGSITGAPKIRAIEIISDIEKTPRGISMGSIGYFSLDGRFDLNVAIRTITINDRVATFHTGGGIVADSVPEVEYEESLLKAKALFNAMNCQGLQSRSRHAN